MSPRDLAPDRHFVNREAQVALGLFSALLGVIGLAMLSEPASRGSGVVFMLVGGVFVIRALRSSTVVVDESGVSTRSILRTRRYAFTELRGVEVAVGRTGITGVGREYLVFRRSHGPDVVFKELNSPPPPRQTEASSVVRRAAACINERLSRTP